jgi:vacuolar-type H+-ATPase subunit H
MKSLKFLTIIALLAFFANTQKVLAQGSDIDLLKEQIEAKKNEISVNEEILISGISALKRVNISLQELKDKQASREEIARKQKVVSSVQKRLSNLKSLIQVKKTELAPLESKLLRKTKKAQEKLASNKTTTNTKTGTIADVDVTDKDAERLNLLKIKLENARKKLEADRKAREIAYLNEQEALRLQAEQLNKLDSQIKAKEESIVKEKTTLISDYEDDISINEEILLSGIEGLNKMKSKLETAKKDSTTSKESIQRKQAIIIKIEARLAKIRGDINAKKIELEKLKQK